MTFKKIEVFGFKSFADKLEIKFDAGITAIVGPNGCGKSNVADSIRWVLGEQSAKTLRGSSMQDVIFNGTEARKSLSYCEVSLFFDNTDRSVALDFNEIVITRKLYRDGTSEYLINRTNCRLKDIVELLRDSGMGREGYSIIGQGRIDEILSAKPDDRRAVFEEAAGISKFKSRKVDAERKLERTRDNLARICDIISELERQLEPLSRQAESARKYLDFREKLKHHEVNIYINRYETAAAAKSAIQERLDAVVAEYEMRNSEYERAITLYSETMERINSLDGEIGVMRDELLLLTVGLEKQAGEINVLNEKVNNLREQNERLERDMARYNAEFAEITAAIESKTAIHAQKSAVLRQNYKLLEEVNSKYLGVIDTLTLREDQTESTQREVMEAMTRLSDIKSNMSRLTSERDSLNEREKDVEKRAQAVENKITDDEIKAILLSGEIDKLESDRRAALAKRDSLSESYNEGQSKSLEYNRHIEQLNIKYNTSSARLKMLSDIHNDSQGLSYSVKKILSDMSVNHYVKDRVEGIIAKLIKVPEVYEAALEVALGNSLQNIVTRTERDAQDIVAYLKQNNYGRATFLPMETIRGRGIDPDLASRVKRPGCYGAASSLITFDSKYDNIIKYLLGRTIIVDNLDIAVKLARDIGYSLKIVTLDGDVVNPQGSISGGSRKNELANILSHERELDKAAKDVEEYRKSLAHATRDREAIAASQARLLDEVKSYSERVHNYDVVIATNKEKHDKLVIGAAEQKRELAALNQERERMLARITEIDNDIKSVDELETLISTRRDDASGRAQKNQAETSVLKKERDTLHEDMTAVKVKIAAAESEILSLEGDLGRLKNSIIEISAGIDDAGEQIAQNNATLETASAAILSTRDERRPEDEIRVNEIREKLTGLDDYKQHLQSRLVDCDAEKTSLMHIIQRLTDAQYKERSLLEKVDIDIEVSKTRIFDEYQLVYETCLEYKQDDYDLSEGETAAAKLKRQISALGYVNVAAIEDCKEVGQRYADLSVQRDDLLKAEGDLTKIISDVTAEMVSKFSTQFAQINKNFSKVFKELFGGGNANLVLDESGEDMLEAGIDIVAEPPGKKLQSISLLSGGERALTAIAILFAILKLRPMPFCVLDEIEAALDDANAERFAKYLRRFSEDTQFIVITHRKPTMELADGLYGVTMEEKGVSKMVSVKLSEAVTLQSEA